MDRSVSFRALPVAAAIILATLAAASAQTTTTSPSGTTSTDLSSLISQLGASGLVPTSSGSTTTTTQPTTPPTDGGGGTGEDTRPPVTNGALPAVNVGLGALQQRAPGLMVAAGLGAATGSLEIPGDAEDFEQPSFVKNTVFDMTQAAVEAIQAGIPLMFQSFLTGLGLGGGGTLPTPGPINVGPPLSNQTTTSSGTVVPVP